MYLLDTNVCIDFALARSGALREKVRASFRKGLAISTVTLAELRVGAKDAEPADDVRLDNLVRTISIREFDSAAADTYGQIARQIGVQRRNFDRLIAAHAVSAGLVLVSRNMPDFAKVPGLKVENWTV